MINETVGELRRDFPSLMHTPTQYSRVDWRLRLRERDEIKVNGGEGFRCRIILLDWAAQCVCYTFPCSKLAVEGGQAQREREERWVID